MPERIIQLRDNGRYCAGLVLEQLVEGGEWRVVKAAPILKWTLGKNWDDLKQFLRKRGIGYQEVEHAKQPNQKNDANDGS